MKKKKNNKIFYIKNESGWFLTEWNPDNYNYSVWSSDFGIIWTSEEMIFEYIKNVLENIEEGYALPKWEEDEETKAVDNKEDILKAQLICVDTETNKIDMVPILYHLDKIVEQSE